MVNSDVLTRMGISAPRTWDDLLEPVYRELVWLPAYDTAEGRLFVRAMMEYFGDDAADYLTQLDTSAQFYTTGTDTAAKCLSTGECVIGIGWLSTGLTAPKLWQEFALSPQCMELMEDNGCSRFPTVWDGQETMPDIDPAQLKLYGAETEETSAAVDEVIAAVMETLAENGVDTEDAARWHVA